MNATEARQRIKRINDWADSAPAEAVASPDPRMTALDGATLRILAANDDPNAQAELDRRAANRAQRKAARS